MECPRKQLFLITKRRDKRQKLNIRKNRARREEISQGRIVYFERANIMRGTSFLVDGEKVSIFDNIYHIVFTFVTNNFFMFKLPNLEWQKSQTFKYLKIIESRSTNKYFHLLSDNLLFFIYNRNLNSTKWPYNLEKGRKMVNS